MYTFLVIIRSLNTACTPAHHMAGMALDMAMKYLSSHVRRKGEVVERVCGPPAASACLHREFGQTDLDFLMINLTLMRMWMWCVCVSLTILTPLFLLLLWSIVRLLAARPAQHHLVKDGVKWPMMMTLSAIDLCLASKFTKCAIWWVMSAWLSHGYHRGSFLPAWSWRQFDY